MESTKIKLSIANKGEFVGLFSLCPVSEADIAECEMQKLASIQELWTPILGFRENQISYSYRLEDINSADLAKWKDRLYPRAERSFSLDSLSLIFASLETPDDYFAFAKYFGALFAFDLNSVEAYCSAEQPNMKAIYELFNLRIGKKTVNKTHFLKENGDASSVYSFERLSDWLLASNILKLAFTLTDLCERDFLFYNEESFIEVCKEAHVPLFGLIPLGENWFSIPLRLNPLSFRDSDYRISNESDYCNILKKRTRLYSEAKSNTSLSCNSNIHIDDLGCPRMEIELPMLCAINKKTLRCAMRSICDCLFQQHSVNLQLTMQEGTYKYCFDSLLTFLWYDYSQVVIGTRNISVCNYCGKPFFCNNGGHIRKYCNDVCRNNAKNQRDKRYRKN